MKNKILLGAIMLIACAYSQLASAQLKIGDNGNVCIHFASDTITPISWLSVGSKGRTDATFTVTNNGFQVANTHYGIHSHVTNNVYPTTLYGIYGQSSGRSLTKIGVGGEAAAGQYSTSKSYGIYGVVHTNLTSGYYYGVYGAALPNQTGNGYGAGIFGTNQSGEVLLSNRYAGYFYGETYVNGDFNALTMNCTSDARLKTDIRDINADAVQKIRKLHPVQFQWLQVEDIVVKDTVAIKTPHFSTDIDFSQAHYGLLAQEVQKIFPDLVREGGDGYLSLNYVELIPLLIQAVQELSAEVEELKKQVNK